MTPAPQDRPQTVLDLLVTPGEDSPGILARDLMSPEGGLGSALENVPATLREAAIRETTSAASGLLDIDVVGLLVGGWRKHHDVVAAARRTVAAPGSAELVDLVAHQITAAQHPAVTLLVDDQRLATVRLGVSVVFDVSAVVAGIRAGRLVALHSGRCHVTATLAVQETEVISRQMDIELPGMIPLGRGFRLLGDQSDPGDPGDEESQASVA